MTPPPETWPFSSKLCFDNTVLAEVALLLADNKCYWTNALIKGYRWNTFT